MARRVAPLPAMAALLVAGCASLEKQYGDPLSVARFDEIEARAHYSTVLQHLGPPTRLTALAQGMAFQYEYVRIDERQYGLLLPGEIGKWIKAVYGSAEATVDAMVFVFDGGGYLRSADSEVFTADAGGGFSMTLIFSIGSLTDTADYEASADSIVTWGRGLTEPLLLSLNRDQDLETGANGIALPGTPSAVGQHSLELRDR